jgi:hypothetical protein
VPVLVSRTHLLSPDQNHVLEGEISKAACRDSCTEHRKGKELLEAPFAKSGAI